MGEFLDLTDDENKDKIFSEPYPELIERPRCFAEDIDEYLQCLSWPNNPYKVRITWPNDVDDITGSTLHAHYIRIDRFSGKPVDQKHTSIEVEDLSSDSDYKSIEIDGLYPNYFYKVRISDKDEVTTGVEWRDKSIIIKPGHIHPPYYIKAYAISDTAIRLYWQGYADYYEIRYRKTTDAKWEIISNIQLLQYTLYELDTDAKYEFQVRCANNSGFISYWGPAPCVSDIHSPSIPTDIRDKLSKKPFEIDNTNEAMLSVIKDSYPDPLIVDLKFEPSKPRINIEDSDVGPTNIKFTIEFPEDVEYPWGGAIDPRAKRFQVSCFNKRAHDDDTKNYSSAEVKKAAHTIVKTFRLAESYRLENLTPDTEYEITCVANNGEKFSELSDTVAETTTESKLVFQSADSAITIKVKDNKIGWIPSNFNTHELNGTTANPEFPESWVRNGGRRAGIYYDTYNKRLVFDPTYARKYPDANYVLKFYDTDDTPQQIGKDLKFKDGYGDWEKFWEINWNPFLLDIDLPYHETDNPTRETLVVKLYEGN